MIPDQHWCGHKEILGTSTIAIIRRSQMNTDWWFGLRGLPSPLSAIIDDLTMARPLQLEMEICHHAIGCSRHPIPTSIASR